MAAGRTCLLGGPARSGRDPTDDPAGAAARTKCWSGPCTPASAAAPRRWCTGGRYRPASTPRCGRHSRRVTFRTGEVWLPQRRHGRGRVPRTWSAVPCSASTRTRPPMWCRRPPWSRCPTGCRQRGPCSPGRWRPPSTPYGTPRRWSATGSPWLAPVWSVAAWPLSRPGSRAPRSNWSTSIRAGPTSRTPSVSSLPSRPPRRRARPRHPHQRDGGRTAAVTATARPRGHRHRTKLVRRPRGQPVPRRVVPRRPAQHPQQPGRRRGPGPPGQPDPRGPAGAGAAAVAGPGLRRVDQRRVPDFASCRLSWPR